MESIDLDLIKFENVLFLVDGIGFVLGIFFVSQFKFWVSFFYDFKFFFFLLVVYVEIKYFFFVIFFLVFEKQVEVKEGFVLVLEDFVVIKIVELLENVILIYKLVLL